MATRFRNPAVPIAFHLLALLCAATLAATVSAALPLETTASSLSLIPPTPPAEDFSLANWTLQLPLAQGGSVQQVTGDKLEAGYTSEYFQSGTDRSMIFWCPVNGGTTANSHYPRSELRQTAPGGDWTFAGDHELRASCKVLVVPSSGRVIIGQIHGHLDQSEIIKLEWDNGKVYAAVEPDRAGEIQLALGAYKLGDSLVYSIHMQAGMLDVQVGSRSVKYDYTAATWKTDTYYFKAGAYTQDNAGSPSEGAKVAFYSLQTYPTPVAIAAQPALASASKQGPAGSAAQSRIPLYTRPGSAFSTGPASWSSSPAASAWFDSRGRFQAGIKIRP